MGFGLDLRGRRRDGSEFPVDVSLAPSVAGGRVVVGAFIRDATDRRRSEDLQRFINEVSRSALAGEDGEPLLSLIAERARRLVGAAVAWVAIRQHPDRMVVAAAEGASAADLVGASLPVDGSLAARAVADGATVSVEDMASDPRVLPEGRALGLGPGLYLPMLAEGSPVGSLVVARSPGARAFSPQEVSTGEVFASAAAIVVSLDTVRQALEAARMTSEHERIARDLHDTVIQRLFALGMRLQATGRLARSPVAEGIRDTVDAIDEVIREIRETIFDLNRPDAYGSQLRHLVRSVAGEAADHLGFTPRLAFRGPVEVAISDEVAAHVRAVLTEALSNVTRHARASHVDVILEAGDTDVTLTVADDGTGGTGAPTAGSGTANMAERAASLGGVLRITERSPTGTLVEWRVPRGR
jgi:signal transduction histidine kinase